MLSDSDHVVVDLLHWCSSRGIQIDARIRVARGEDGDVCVLTRDAFIERRTTLVSIPKSAILSIRNCLLAEHIPQVIYGTEAQLGLALGLYGELLRGTSSTWFGYLQSLPKHVSIALFWDDVSEDEKIALKWIKGTMADVELSMLSQAMTPDLVKGSKYTVTDILRYYEFTALPALAKVNFEGRATLEDFKHAYALVTSRSFIVDAYHGLAMVPIADAFNHNLENHVHLESDHEVCRTCGSLKECSHDSEDEGAGERIAAREERVLSGLNDLEDTCEMVANASIPPFTEVFNTYGEHLTNAQLLVRYGFLLDGNENDIISWDMRELCRFVTLFADRSNEGEKWFDEGHASKDHDLGFNIFEKRTTEIANSAATYKHHDISRFHVGDGEAVLRSAGTDMGNEDQVSIISSGQVLLERLREVLDLWACGDTTWANSNLVYFPNIQEAEPDVDSYGEDARLPWLDSSKFEAGSSAVDGSVEARNEDARPHEENIITRPRRRGKHSRPYFAVNDEAKISHHLWIFCVLLALHAERLRLHVTETTDADLKTKLESEDSSILPRRNEESKHSTFLRAYATHASRTERHASRLSSGSEAESDVMQSAFVTAAEEDVALLQRIVLVQNSLEKLSLDSELEMDTNGVSEKEGMYSCASPSESSAMNTKQTLGTRTAPDTEGQGPPEALLASLSSTNSAAHRREVHSDGVRKRIRRSSASSSISNRSDGGRPRIRPRGNERVSVKASVESTREGSEDTYENADGDRFETKLGPLEESLSVASRRNRRRDDGLLSAFLHDYGDDSDNALHSDSDSDSDFGSEVQIPSAVGGGLRKGSQHDGKGYLTDMDTRARAAQKSELEPYFPEKEGNISDLHDRRSDDGSGSSSFDSVSASASKSQNVPKGRDSESAWRDASLVRLVASIARIVSALCATRSCRMAYPDLGVAELGDIADAIPSEMTQAGMAAQLALTERARLEGCTTAWKELELAAPQFYH